jgi:hypothetical protein
MSVAETPESRATNSLVSALYFTAWPAGWTPSAQIRLLSAASEAFPNDVGPLVNLTGGVRVAANAQSVVTVVGELCVTWKM